MIIKNEAGILLNVEETSDGFEIAAIHVMSGKYLFLGEVKPDSEGDGRILLSIKNKNRETEKKLRAEAETEKVRILLKMAASRSYSE